MRFSGKVVLLTGGDSGIGQETCLHFLNQGASLVFISNNREKGLAVQQEYLDKGLPCVYHFCEMPDEAAIRSTFNLVTERFGRLDVLINNAANAILKSFDATVEDWQKILGVNIIGNFLMAKYAAEIMKQQKSGSIINIASISGVIAQPHQMTYNTSKAGIIGMTKCMALELAPWNIRVNAISPGYVRTAQLERDIRESGMTEDDVKTNWGSKHMLGRIAQTAEIAPTVLFLADNQQSSFITGANILVDGGYTSW